MIELLIISCMISDGVMAGFDSITTSAGVSYTISDYSATYSEAASDCATQDSAVATFTDNDEYRDFIDFLGDTKTYKCTQIWLSITQSGSKYYFYGGGEIDSENWFDGENDGSLCGGEPCCYRVTIKSGKTKAKEHKLAGEECTESFNVVCKPIVTTTKTTTSTTPAPTTTTTTITTTTTTTTTTTAATTTTALQSTTTIITLLPATTTTSSLPITTPLDTTLPTTTTITTSSLPITTTAATTIPTITPTTPLSITTTTSTTPIPITTTTANALPTTTTTTIPLSTTTITSANPIPAAAPSGVELSKGEQMSIMYLGVIIGGSLGISCVCSTCWLILFRGMRRRRKDQDLKDDEELALESDSDSD